LLEPCAGPTGKHGSEGPRRSNAPGLPDRDVRPVKIQQRTPGGCWRTLAGLADFAVVASYLSTATKWGLDSYDVLVQLFTTGLVNS